MPLDDVALACVSLFSEAVGLKNSPDGHRASPESILVAPIDSFEIDSLSTMEFVMAVEDHFDVVLDEKAVNQCATIAELASLVRLQRRV